jgi:hypothetical protein
MAANRAAPETEWLNRFLTRLGQKPAGRSIAEAMTWAMSAHKGNPRGSPDDAAEAFASGQRVSDYLRQTRW